MGMKHHDRKRAAQDVSKGSTYIRSSNATLVCKDVISEGPIYGLVNGPASVYLNNQPLIDSKKVPFHASKSTTRLSVTNGSTAASLINATPELLARLKDEQTDVDYIAVKGAFGSIQSTVEAADSDEAGIMVATKVSGQPDFESGIVSSWHGYASAEVVIPARIKGTAYTNFRDIEITIISRISGSKIRFKIGEKNSGPTALLLPEGTYTVEIDRVIDIAKVTSVDSTQLIAGALAQVHWIEEAKKTPRNSVYWEEITATTAASMGWDGYGPPFLKDTTDIANASGYVSSYRRTFKYGTANSISLGYAKNHFSWCWFGYFKPPTTGEYDFQLTSDDGAGIWIGNEASISADANKASRLRHRHSTVVNVALGGKTSEATRAGSKRLEAGVYYPVRIVHYNVNGPGKFVFEWRKAGVGDDYTTSLASHWYYPSAVNVKDRNFIDLENIVLTNPWGGTTGEYPIDLGPSTDLEEDPSQEDYVDSSIKGASVGFRVGDLFQSQIPSPEGFSHQNYSGNVQAITKTPKPGADLKQHVDFVDSELSPHSGVQSTIIQATGDNGLNLSSEQILNLDSLRFSIQYPNGMGQTNGDGTLVNTLAVYRVSIKFKNVGESNFESEEYVLWENMMHKYSNDGKGTRNALTFDSDLDLSKFSPFADFQLIIKRKTAGEGSRGYTYANWKNGLTHKHTMQSAAVIGPCTAIIKEQLTYPYTAYAKTSYSTLSFKDMPKRTYHCKGLLVKVPSNYVTRDEAVGGVASYTRNVSTGAIEQSYQDWDGSLRDEPVYTNNPAWIFYDIITNNRYGLGSFMSTSDIDIYALYRIARYCDELVDTGIRAGQKEPRFTCNVYLTKQADAYKVLKDLCTNFRSMLYWFDSQIVPVLDQPQEPVYNFSKANVINGSFNYESTGSKTRANQIMVSWNNPANDYYVEGLLCEDRENIIRTGKVILEKAYAFGCTSESQAKRYGRWKLWTGINQTEIATFETALNAKFLVPGDIINIQDSDRDRIRYSGRISNTGTPSVNTIPLDHNVTLKADHTYRLSVLFVKSAAFLAQKTADIHTTTAGNGSPESYVEGDLITHAWFYNNTSLTWERLPIQSETQATNARENTTTTEALLLSWAPHTRIETKEVTTSAGDVSSLTVSGGFSAAPDAESIWVLEELDTDNIKTDSSAKEYKIMAIEEKEGGVFAITSARHYNNKFDSIENETYRISVESSPERALPREIQAPPPPSMALEYVD